MRSLLVLVLVLVAAPGCVHIPHSSPSRPQALSHEEVDRLLAAEVHLRLPARALVVPSPERARPLLHHRLTDALAESANYIASASPAAPADASMEQARAMAARQAIPYAIVCRESYEHVEGWTPLRILYAAIVTALFVPGESLDTRATLEAALVDVHTGLVVFTAHANVRETSDFIRVGRTPAVRREHEEVLAERGAKELAAKIEIETRRRLELQPPDMPASAREQVFFETRRP